MDNKYNIWDFKDEQSKTNAENPISSLDSSSSSRKLETRLSESSNSWNQNVCAHCGRESVEPHSFVENASTSTVFMDDDGDTNLSSPKANKIRKQELAAQNLMRPNEEEASEWIFCDSCRKWFHALCVEVQQYELSLIDRFHCPSCRFEHGDSVMKVKLLSHRYAFDNEEERDLPMQIGSEKWIQEFSAQYMENISEVPADMFQLYNDGVELKRNFNFTESWTKPIKVRNKRGLGLSMPDYPDFDVMDIIKILGGDVFVDTIDVFAQRTHTMTLDRFYHFWRKRKRDRLYNILSLEFSETKLSDIVRSPSLVRELSWVYRFWPNDEQGELKFEGNMQQQFMKEHELRDQQSFDVYEFSENPTWQKQRIPVHEEQHLHESSRPYVENFCLMGMQGSYTDFHIDFGGSSVWYHVFKGSKVFFIARPSEQNMEAFLKWQNHKDHSEQFFGDLLPPDEKLYRFHVSQGETLLLPSGWIHSVYTPSDSLVFGGNFLHSLNVPMQLKVFDMENKADIDGRFRFPFFEMCNFYAAKSIVEKLKDCSATGILADKLTIDAGNALLSKCTEWISKSSSKFHIFNGMVKQLNSELKRQKKLQHRLSSKRNTMVLSSGEPSLPFTEWNKDSGSNKMDDVQDLDSSWEEEDAEPMGEDDILSFSRNEEKPTSSNADLRQRKKLDHFLNNDLTASKPNKKASIFRENDDEAQYFESRTETIISELEPKEPVRIKIKLPNSSIIPCWRLSLVKDGVDKNSEVTKQNATSISRVVSGEDDKTAKLDIGHIFTRRSTHDRHIRPTARMLDLVEDGIDAEPSRRDKDCDINFHGNADSKCGLKGRKNFMAQFTQDELSIINSAEQAAEQESRGELFLHKKSVSQKRKKSEIQQKSVKQAAANNSEKSESAIPKKKVKKETNSRERLFKKLGLNRKK